jgi:hypothetical protein
MKTYDSPGTSVILIRVWFLSLVGHFSLKMQECMRLFVGGILHASASCLWQQNTSPGRNVTAVFLLAKKKDTCALCDCVLSSFFWVVPYSTPCNQGTSWSLSLPPPSLSHTHSSSISLALSFSVSLTFSLCLSLSISWGQGGLWARGGWSAGKGKKGLAPVDEVEDAKRTRSVCGGWCGEYAQAFCSRR